MMSFDAACDHLISCGPLKGRRIAEVHQSLGAHGLLAMVRMYHKLSFQAASKEFLTEDEEMTFDALKVYLAAEPIHRQIARLAQNDSRGQRRFAFPRADRPNWTKVRESIPSAI